MDAKQIYTQNLKVLLEAHKDGTLYQYDDSGSGQLRRKNCLKLFAAYLGRLIEWLITGTELADRERFIRLFRTTVFIPFKTDSAALQGRASLKTPEPAKETEQIALSILNQRKAVFEALQPSFPLQQQSSLCSIVQNQPENEKLGVLFDAALCLDASLNKDQQTSILEIFQQFLLAEDAGKKSTFVNLMKITPPADRMNTAKTAELFFLKESSPQNISEFDEALKTVGETARKKLLEEASPLLNKLSDTKHKAYALQLLAEFSRDERLEIIDLLIFSTYQAEQDVQIIAQLQTLCWIPKKQRSREVSGKLFSLFQNITGSSQFQHILTRIKYLLTKKKFQAESIAGIAPILKEIQLEWYRESILQSMENFPELEWKPLLTDALPFLKGIKTGWIQGNIIKEMGKIAAGERKFISGFLAPAIQQLTDGRQRAAVINAFSKIPENRREAVISKAEPWVSKCFDAEQIGRSLQAFSYFPQDHLNNTLIQSIFLLFKDIHYRYNNFSLLTTLLDISAAERSSLVLSACPLIERTGDEQVRGAVLETLSSTAPDQREEIIEITANLADQSSGEAYILDILRIVKDLPPEHRRKNTYHALPLLAGINNSEETACIIRAVAALSEEKVESISKQAASLFRNIINGYQRALSLRAINLIPTIHCSDVIAEMVISLFKGISNEFDGIKLLEVIKDIPENQRAEVIVMIQPILEYNKRGCSTISTILSHFNLFSPEENKNYNKQLLSLLEKRGDNSQLFSQIFLAIHYIPKENLNLKVLEASVYLFKRLKEKQMRYKAILTLALCPREKTAAVLLNTLPLIGNAENAYYIHNILYAMQYLPIEKFPLLVAPQGPLTRRIQCPAYRSKLILALAYIDPENWHRFITTCSCTMDDSCNYLNLIENYFTVFPEKIASSHEYLKTRLLSITNLEEARYLTLKIAMNPEVFQIEENSLFLPIINSIITAIKEKGPKNAYRVYEQMQRESRRPAPEFSLPVEKYGEKTFTISLENLQNIAAAAKPILFKDLPEIDSPAKMFGALYQRLSKLEKKQKEEVLKNIVDITGMELDKLQENFTMDSFVDKLIERGKPEEAASQYQVCFTAIMRYIMDQKHNSAANELSAREYALLQASNSIQECSFGKQVLSISMYNLLPQKYKFHKTELIALELKEAHEYLFQTTQEILDTVCSTNNSFLQKAAQTESPKQLAHQTTFIKNRIFRYIGLVHNIEFDFSTQILYDDLYNLPLKDLLVLFFEHLTPGYFAAKMKKKFDMDQLPIQHLKIFNSMNQFELPIPLNEVWEFDGEDMLTGNVTEKGIWAILEAAGFFKQQPNS